MILDDVDVEIPIFDHPGLDMLNADPAMYFYLTGSRYCRLARDGSDWDFLLQDGSEAQRWLEAHGFQRLMDPEYDEGALKSIGIVERHPFTVSVWHWEFAFREVAPIQVKLVRSVVAARLARDIIYKTGDLWAYDRGLHRTGDKTGRAALWLAAARLAAVAVPMPPLPPEPAKPDLFADLQPITDDQPF